MDYYYGQKVHLSLYLIHFYTVIFAFATFSSVTNAKFDGITLEVWHNVFCTNYSKTAMNVGVLRTLCPQSW